MAGSAAPSPTEPAAPEALTDSEIVAIEHACAKLYHRLGIAADSDFEGFVDCFSPDVVWARPTMTMRGHDEVRAFLVEELERMRRGSDVSHLTRHLYTTIVVDVRDRQRAVGRAYAMIYRDEEFTGTTPVAMTDPEVVVDYQTEFKLVDGAWKISHHTAKVVFSRHA